MAQYGAMLHHHHQQQQQQQQQQPWLNRADVKPRLTKEQHDILEAHFRQQHKPSTQTKKGFADTLGVPLDKINNWFQNRRAKVKQDAKKAINAHNMFLQQQMAHHMHAGAASLHHPDFYPGGQPQLGPSPFPVDAPGGLHLDLAGDGQPGMLPVGPVPGQHAHHGFDMAPKPDLLAFPPEHDFPYGHFGLTSVHDFGAVYADFSNVDGMDPPFLPGAAMQAMQSNGSTPSIPSTLSSMPSQSTVPSCAGAVGAPATVASAEWGDDYKPTICFSEAASDGTVGPQAAYCSPPQDDGNTARWVSQQPPFDHTPHPDLVDCPGSSQKALPPTPPDNGSVGSGGIANHHQLSPEVERLPQVALSRRPSPSGLSDHLGDVDIHARGSGSSSSNNGDDDGFKQPGEPRSLAARRQRPRPAALGQASLRSVSYSAGMPASPGSNPNNLSAPDQQLRRIRSSGVAGAQAGRVQKPGASGQRSPLHMNFTDTADSPKFARHAPTWDAALPSPGVQSLAPPTPLTPHDAGRFPSWQSLGSVASHHTSVDHSSPNGFALSWTAESPALFPPSHTVSSPPETPLDAAQAAQYNEWVHAGRLRGNSPPQSAPAFQQGFYPAGLGVPVIAENHHLLVHHPHMGHVRKSSLPEHIATMAAPAPMFQTMHGDGPLHYQQPLELERLHLQHMPAQPPATLPSQTSQSFPTPPQPAPAVMPAQASVVSPDFAVHEYLPPGAQSSTGNGASPGAVAEGGAPKMFHFSNTGPQDFAASA